MSYLLIDMPARALLLPVLVAQALRVRQSALKLPEAAGPRSGVMGAGPDLRLLILGDSSAAGVGAGYQEMALAGQLTQKLAETHRVVWQLEATTGHTTRDALRRLNALGDLHFDVAVVALGVNDVTHAVPLFRWLKMQRELIEILSRRHGVSRICLSGLPPMGEFPLLPNPLRWVLGRQARRFDRHLRHMISNYSHVSVTPMEFDLDISHMAEDGFHPSPRVYSEWANRVFKQIIARQEIGVSTQSHEKSPV